MSSSGRVVIVDDEDMRQAVHPYHLAVWRHRVSTAIVTLCISYAHCDERIQDRE